MERKVTKMSVPFMNYNKDDIIESGSVFSLHISNPCSSFNIKGGYCLFPTLIPLGLDHTVNPNLWRSCLPYRYLQDMDNVAVIKMVPSVW